MRGINSATSKRSCRCIQANVGERVACDRNGDDGDGGGGAGGGDDGGGKAIASDNCFLADSNWCCALCVREGVRE